MRRASTLLALALLAGCPPEPANPDGDSGGDSGGDGDSGDAYTPENVPLDGACDDAARWGAFLVDSNEDYAYVTGSVADGVVPASVLTNVLTSGECTIWRRENPFCDPGCEPGYTCAFDGTCVPYPTAQDLGVVEVSGLSSAVAMEPVTPGYTYFDTSLANPPWEPGALVTVASGGGAYAPFRLYGVAPASLVPASMDWLVVEGAPLVVAWDAPAGPVRTEVALTLRLDQHGTTPSSVECVFADDGGGEVPAEVLAELMSRGVTGFPAGDLVRRTVDAAPVGDGCVDLTLGSSRLAFVSIEGYTPCRDDRECPEGQTCNEALERCE